jgi:hypothetical protein
MHGGTSGTAVTSGTPTSQLQKYRRFASSCQTSFFRSFCSHFSQIYASIFICLCKVCIEQVEYFINIGYHNKDKTNLIKV